MISHTLIAARVSVVGKDVLHVEAMANYLKSNGCPAEIFVNKSDFLARMQQAPPSLVLLEAAGWPSDGVVGLVAEIRAVSPVPCILRAHEADETDQRVQGLENGIDDWIAVNTPPREVLARIRAVLRRSLLPAMSMLPAPGALNTGIPKASNWRLSAERRELFTPGGVACLLTSAEFDLLRALVEKRGVALPRDVLFARVFQRPWHPEDRAIDNLVARLRRKLAAHSPNPGIIKPVRGIGYIFTGF